MFQAFKAAREAGNEVWKIGVDSDQYNVPSLADVKKVIRICMLNRVGVAVFEVIEGVASGSPLVGYKNFDRCPGYQGTQAEAEGIVAAAILAIAVGTFPAKSGPSRHGQQVSGSAH